ncbi:hypothetical protein MASR1M8_08600 [Thermomonas brevis]
MTNTHRHLVRTTLLAALFLQSSVAVAQWKALDAETLRLDGSIEADSHDQYLKLATPSLRKVVLNSPGGYELPAALIASDLLGRGNVDIIVDGMCASSCANQLLPVSKRPTVNCGSLLAWHGSRVLAKPEPESLHDDGYPPDIVEKQVAWWSRLNRLTMAAYEANGISASILRDSVVAAAGIEPETATTYSFNETTGGISVSESSSAVAWIPTRSILQTYGYDTSDFCPSYDDDMDASVRRIAGDLLFTKHAVDP